MLLRQGWPCGERRAERSLRFVQRRVYARPAQRDASASDASSHAAGGQASSTRSCESEACVGRGRERHLREEPSSSSTSPQPR